MKQSPQHLPIIQSLPAVKKVPSGPAQFNLHWNTAEEPVIGALPSAQKCCKQKTCRILGDCIHQWQSLPPRLLHQHHHSLVPLSCFQKSLDIFESLAKFSWHLGWRGRGPEETWLDNSYLKNNPVLLQQTSALKQLPQMLTLCMHWFSLQALNCIQKLVWHALLFPVLVF